MKKTQSKRSAPKRGTSVVSASLAVSSALLFMPGAAGQNAMAQKAASPTTTGSSSAQSNAVFKFFRPSPLYDNARVVGSTNNMIIFQSTAGKYFSIDSKTGDIKEYSSDIFIKHDGKERTSSSSIFIKFENFTMKGREGFAIVGSDASGNTIMKTKTGELFTIDPKTGDMKFVK